MDFCITWTIKDMKKIDALFVEFDMFLKMSHFIPYMRPMMQLIAQSYSSRELHVSMGC